MNTESPHVLRRDRFTPLLDQHELDRLTWLERRKRARRERQAALRRSFGIALIFAGQVALILLVSARHEAWPW